MEINANGLRRSVGYPNASSWRLSKLYKLTTIISSDTPDPHNLVEGAVRQAGQLAADWRIAGTSKLMM